MAYSLIYIQKRMKSKDHLEKARRIHRSVEKLDPEEDRELVVEGSFGAMIHYIAYISEEKVRDHKETHSGLSQFLDDKGFSGLARKFRSIGLERQKRWYGGQSNGDISGRVLSIVSDIAERANAIEGIG